MNPDESQKLQELVVEYSKPKTKISRDQLEDKIRSVTIEELQDAMLLVAAWLSGYRSSRT